ncbi:MAG: hypothetical protein AAFZ15_00605 [Bacteroidota bacterium]
MQKKRLFSLLIKLICAGCGMAQCPLPNAIIYQSDNPIISMDSIARLTAPVLWFSPDEPNLYDAYGNITLPAPFPFDDAEQKPTVYYKIKNVYSDLKTHDLIPSDYAAIRSRQLDLSKTKGLEIEHYGYFPTETGVGSHQHDIGSTAFQVEVHRHPACDTFAYVLEVKRILARAHGLYWFNNNLNVDQYTLFPITILVEEGKHAKCTDKNADGEYTPTYDVNEKVNDAWGVRDIITTGRLVSGGYQAWMQKSRRTDSVIFPPPSGIVESTKKIQKRFVDKTKIQTYQLLPFPALPENYEDGKLVKIVKDRRPKAWPKTHTSINKKKKFRKLSSEYFLPNDIGFAYRFDSGSGASFSLPLLLFRHVEAPMTGGWLYHKLYFNDVKTDANEVILGKWGHQIQYAASASRWIDSYVGLGYEFVEDRSVPGSSSEELMFASEAGFKFRFNISSTPAKFLRYLGTNYWGLRIGWKNLGFSAFDKGAFVVEIGAGAF